MSEYDKAAEQIDRDIEISIMRKTSGCLFLLISLGLLSYGLFRAWFMIDPIIRQGIQEQVMQWCSPALCGIGILVSAVIGLTLLDPWISKHLPDEEKPHEQ